MIIFIITPKVELFRSRKIITLNKGVTQLFDDTLFDRKVLRKQRLRSFGHRFFDGASLAQNDDLLSATIIIIAIANAILSYRKVYPNGYGYNSPHCTRRKYTSAFSLSFVLHPDRSGRIYILDS